MGGIKGKISTAYAKDKKYPFLKYLSGSLVKAVIDRFAHPYIFADYLYKPEQDL